ncbi:hypothetical protein [Phaeobacter sp. B1627]|uniref:hypothetical protein n=1 Tax=Phaeobacter sp. B1627 TaxID=2583809 RepID=UPI00111A8E67|nr:hypothetical protein [Phaeobacter sp. B1627]TNJ40889.1 hypothetical protein FGE21_15970 [Phaeobacter sp. B1627]
MEDFTVLDQKIQNVSATSFRGKLGFADRSETTLSTASTIVVNTLQEYGHEVDQFQARRAHRISLDCDQYTVGICHRRSPTPMRQLDGEACRSSLAVTLTPRYPDHTDEELSEMLMARVLYDLLGELDATTVEWLDTGVVLDRAAFLAVFAAEGVQVAQDIQTPIDTATAKPIGRTPPLLVGEILDPDTTARPAPRSAAKSRQASRRSRFASVEETFGGLTLECDRIIERRDTSRDSGFTQACRKLTDFVSPQAWTPNKASAWVMTAILAILALPLGITAAAVNLVRGGDIRFSVQMMLVLAFIMFLQSSGLGHAGLR